MNSCTIFFYLLYVQVFHYLQYVATNPANKAYWLYTSNTCSRCSVKQIPRIWEYTSVPRISSSHIHTVRKKLDFMQISLSQFTPSLSHRPVFSLTIFARFIIAACHRSHWCLWTCTRVLNKENIARICISVDMSLVHSYACFIQREHTRLE